MPSTGGTISWVASSGNWTTGSDWSSCSAPTSSDDAVIAAAGSYTVYYQLGGCGEFADIECIRCDGAGQRERLSWAPRSLQHSYWPAGA